MSGSETKRCPFCDEEIRIAAIRCKHCNMMLDGASTRTDVTPVPAPVSPTEAIGVAPGVTLTPGSTVNRYQIKSLLGSGGMGEVYLAEHQYTSQQVAIKAVWPNLMAEQGARARFLQEGRTLGRLKHANIVGLQDFFEEGGRFFLVMELLEGVTLDVMLRKKRGEGGQFGIAAVVRVLGGVLEALAHAHGQVPTVVHRDIKPSNVMLAKDGRSILMDFGIAKVVGGDKLTRTRGVVGTYEYMSPEQIQGGEISPATDVYAVGIMAFELLTGRVPFPQASDSGLDTMKAHLESPVPDLRALRPDCPARLAQVVGRALSKLPAQRFADAGEMLAALEAAAALTRKETQKESEVRPRMESGTPIASPPSGLSDRSIGKEPLPVLAPTMTADLERGSGVAGHPLEALPEPYVSSPLPPQRGRIGWWAAGAVVLVVVGLVVGPKIFRSGQDATPATEAESLREKEADRVFAEARKAVEKAEKARKAAQLAAMGTAVEPLQYAEPAEVPKEDIVSPAAPDEPPPDVAAGAREAVETAFKALTAKDVSPLFGLLPDSYVADIDDVVQTFARGMDKELWNKVMNLLDRSIALLARNKTAFAGMLLEFGVPVSAEDVGRALDATVEAWDLLEKAGITDLERLKSFSTRRFAADTLPKVAALVFKLADNTQQKAQVDAALAILAAATVKAESSGERDEKFGEIVTVAVNITGDEESEVFVQVDGKWVPLGLARDWDEGMAEARKAIAEMTTELPTAAPAAMAQLAQIETVLAQMEQTGDLSLLRSMAEGFAQGMATESAPAQ